MILPNNDIEIKELKDVDFDEFVILWNNSHIGHFHSWQKTKKEILDRNKLYGISDTGSKVALVNGKQVAFILTAFGNIDSKLVGWNGATAVLPEYRNQGIAYTLYNSILSDLKKHGIEQAVLELITTNQNALKLYTKLRFKIKYNLIKLDSKLNQSNNLKHKSLMVGTNNNIIKFISSNITEYHLNNQCPSTQFQSLLTHNHTLLNIEINNTLAGYIVYRLTDDKSTLIFHQLFIDNALTSITNELISSILNYFYQTHCNTEEISITLNLWNIENLNTKFIMSFNNNEFKPSFNYYTMKLNL